MHLLDVEIFVLIRSPKVLPALSKPKPDREFFQELVTLKSGFSQSIF